jgi:ATP-binding cassette, subfamily G (WHITE), member 2, SNQ2
MTAFFRLIGTTCRSFDVAARLASFLISGMVLYTGYLIPMADMKRWLFWISYIDVCTIIFHAREVIAYNRLQPLNYGFAALMINEFSHLSLFCDAPYLIPYGPSYDDVPVANKVCTLAGSVDGQEYVNGSDYIRAGFDYHTKDLWRNWGILVAFFVGFQLIQMIVRTFATPSSTVPPAHDHVVDRVYCSRCSCIGRNCVQARERGHEAP